MYVVHYANKQAVKLILYNKNKSILKDKSILQCFLTKISPQKILDFEIQHILSIQYIHN